MILLDKLHLGSIKQFFIDIPFKVVAIPLKRSYLGLDFNVTHRAGAHAPYADGNHIKLVNLGSIDLFNKYRLNSSSGKEMKEINNAHVNCSMYKLKSSSRDSNDLSIVFTEVLKLEKRN